MRSLNKLSMTLGPCQAELVSASHTYNKTAFIRLYKGCLYLSKDGKRHNTCQAELGLLRTIRKLGSVSHKIINVSNLGFCDLIRFNFQSFRQFFSCFSLAIATSILLNVS